MSACFQVKVFCVQMQRHVCMWLTQLLQVQPFLFFFPVRIFYSANMSVHWVMFFLNRFDDINCLIHHIVQTSMHLWFDVRVYKVYTHTLNYIYQSSSLKTSLISQYCQMAKLSQSKFKKKKNSPISCGIVNSDSSFSLRCL